MCSILYFNLLTFAFLGRTLSFLANLNEKSLLSLFVLRTKWLKSTEKVILSCDAYINESIKT